VRIVSDFKDYYDVGRGWDDEDTPVYQRLGVEHVFVAPAGAPRRSREENTALETVQRAAADLWRDDTVPPYVQVEYARVPLPVERCVIGFCGQAFAVYLVAEQVWVAANGSKDRAPLRCCSNLEQLVRALDERRRWHSGHDDDKSAASARHCHDLVERLTSPARPNTWRYREQHARPYEHPLNASTWNRFEAVRTAADARRVPARFFVHFRAPIVAHFDDRLVVNPCLKDLGFHSVLSAQQVWQELSLYLGNTLIEATTPAPRPISDELRAETHGFDRESFRKTKAGRKKLDRGDW